MEWSGGAVKFKNIINKKKVKKKKKNYLKIKKDLPHPTPCPTRPSPPRPCFKMSEVVNLLSSDDDEDSESGTGSSSSSTTTTTTNGNDSDSDVEMVGAPPAITNYPHARFNCLVHPFKGLTKKEKRITCDNCYCFVCDILATDCKSWSDHCVAENTKDWQDKRHNIEWQTSGHEFVGKRIRQHFTGHGFSLGTITKWAADDGDDAAMFHVIHDDGDEEDLDERGVVIGIRAFKLMVATKKRTKGARRAYRDPDLSDGGAGVSDSDSDFSSMGEEEEEEEEEEEAEEEEEEEEEEQEDGSKQSRKRRRRKQSPAAAANHVVTKRRKRTNKKKTKKTKKKTTTTTTTSSSNLGRRAKRMSVHEINVFLRRLVYCLEKGRVNTDEHPQHDVMVRKCAESQRDEFAIAPNTKCVVLGLESDKGKLLNGKRGVVVYLNVTTTPARYVVRLTKTGTWHRLRPGNVKQIPNRGVTICGVTSRPEMNGKTADVVSWREDGKFVVKMSSDAVASGGGKSGGGGGGGGGDSESESEGNNTFLALKSEKLLLPPGTAVVLHSLKSKAELNGVRGCLVKFQKDSGRYIVRIPDAMAPAGTSAEDEMKTVAVKPANIWS